MNDKPANLDQYKTWLKGRHKGLDYVRMRKYFETVAREVSRAFELSAFWKEFDEETKLRDFDERYKVLHVNYPLVDNHQAPKLQTKSFDSFLLKTFRKNVVENNYWPEPPLWEGGVRDWLGPDNWLTRINDVVRTCFVVKYMDGVRFLVDGLRDRCNHHSLICRSNFLSNDDGYYAAHLYIRRDFEIPKVAFDTEIVSMEIELQVTTQLQEVIRKLLHVHYERRRVTDTDSREQWQWDYKSNEFATNYLGHVLHYAEGMILNVRDRSKEP